MKKGLFNLALLISFVVSGKATAQSLTLPPSGDNEKASVTQWIGLVSVNISYNSPDVTGPNGEDRRGKIWGGLVPWGMSDNNFGSAEKMPWRGGANENTTFTVSHDVTVGGKNLPAGTYGLHFIPDPDEWTVIFSNNSSSWGSYFYDESEDALRVKVTPRKGEYTEWLTYEFIERKPNYAVAALKWEEMLVPIKVEADVNSYYLETIRAELRGAPGFTYQNWVQAVNFCVNNDMNLDEALQWADYAINAPFVGQKNFTTMQTKASVLIKLNRNDEADQLMSEAMELPATTMREIHFYGRQLIQMDRPEKAMEVFELNRKRNPDDNFTTYVGLARGYEAVGKNKQAIKNYRLAAENAPQGQREYYEDLAKKLEESK
jgi:hypothetical protein